MRISEARKGSAQDKNGISLITTEGLSVLSSFSTRDAQGWMSAREAGYRQQDERGTGASWSELGLFPRKMVALLTRNELTLAVPDEDSPAQLSVWGKWDMVLPPSFELGEEETVALPWASSPGRTGARGLFAPPTDLQSSVKAGNGCVWVASAGGVTCLDFCTDMATFYQDISGKTYSGGLLPRLVPDDAYGPDNPELACAALPFRAVALRGTRSSSFAVVVGGDSVSLLEKKLSTPMSPHYPTETVTFPGFSPTDVSFLRDGSILAVGTETSASGEAYGRIGWCLRTPIGHDVFGDDAWSGPFFGPAEFPQFTPKIAKDGRWVWVSSGVGHIWRLSQPESEMGPSAELEYWAGPTRAADERDVSPEPRMRSVYPSAALAGLVFDQGLPMVLQLLSAEQGGGSLLCCFNRHFSRVLWTRYYRGTMTGLVPSPMKVPSSRIVTPGRTLDPVLGSGPDDQE